MYRVVHVFRNETGFLFVDMFQKADVRVHDSQAADWLWLDWD